jgi:hypothetical protein
MSPDAALTQLRVQEFIDAIGELDLNRDAREWYNVDVAALIDGCELLGHDLDEQTNRSILFLSQSLLLCDPDTGSIQHHPRNLIHCFVDDLRRSTTVDGAVIFSAEMFSISPLEEQLHWRKECKNEYEIPQIQQVVAHWLRWLNS